VNQIYSLKWIQALVAMHQWTLGLPTVPLPFGIPSLVSFTSAPADRVQRDSHRLFASPISICRVCLV